MLSVGVNRKIKLHRTGKVVQGLHTSFLLGYAQTTVVLADIKTKLYRLLKKPPSYLSNLKHIQYKTLILKISAGKTKADTPDVD